MRELFEPLLVVVMLLDMFVLASSRLRTVIGVSAAQGVVLGVLTITAHGGFDLVPLLVSIGAVVIKAVLIPRLLYKAMRDVAIRREVEPLVGYMPSLLLGALGTGVAVIWAQRLPLNPEHSKSLLLPAAFATVLTGFIILITRRKSIAQVVGYLILENGIFIMGLSLLAAMPYLIEVGVLLDLLVAIFVMGIIINHVSREFGSLDASGLDKLKD
jgi:hydrogenase-4 component E